MLSALPNGKGTEHKKHKEEHKKHKIEFAKRFLCLLCSVLCFLCSVPFPLGKAIVEGKQQTVVYVSGCSAQRERTHGNADSHATLLSTLYS